MAITDTAACPGDWSADLVLNDDGLADQTIVGDNRGLGRVPQGAERLDQRYGEEGCFRLPLA